jgi:hypothetical protein
MKYLYPPLVGFIILILSLGAWVVIPFALLFAKWDTEPTKEVQHGLSLNPYVIRGDLPNWLSWFSTPDERLPGGLYEADVYATYLKRGAFYCSWKWLGFRNVLMGMSAYFGKETTGFLPENIEGFYEHDGIWQANFRLGDFKLILGYKVYQFPNGKFWAMPCFTINNRPKVPK